MTPRISLIVISHNSGERLKACLRSLQPVLGSGEAELIRVDNGSTDGSECLPEGGVIRLDANRGVAYARNRGIEAARGRYILLLDDDTEASADAILGMAQYLDEHPGVGICGAALYDAEGHLQSSFKPYPGLGVKIRNLLLRTDKEPQLPSSPIEPCYIIGACQMMRREVIDQCGLLDEAIFYGPEDADLCIRARQKGWATAYLPHLRIVHHWRRATRRRPWSRLSLMHARGLLHFWAKHRRLF